MHELGFYVKKIISTFCYPLGFSLVIICLGIVLWRTRANRRFGFVVTLIGVAFLVLMSLPITSYLLMRHVESGAGTYADPEVLGRQGVKYVVVLSNAISTSDKPPAERFGSGIRRVMEGIRLWKGIPGSRLVLSGGAIPGRSSKKEAMIELPVQLGIPRNAIIVKTGAMDTEDEAKLFAKIVGRQPFALVTSARHIPRAMAHFRALGLNPQPAPCDFKADIPPPFYSWFLPNAGTLASSQVAIHNWLGSLWLGLKQSLSWR